MMVMRMMMQMKKNVCVGVNLGKRQQMFACLCKTPNIFNDVFLLLLLCSR